MSKVTVDKGKKLTIWDKKDSAIIGAEFLGIIKERTASGVSVTGKDFERYAARYAKDHPGPVDLQESGKMLGSLRVKAYSQRAVITSASKLVFWVNAVRPFLGMLEDEANRLMKTFMLRVDEDIRASNERGGHG
jgi:hypothetical protein